MRRHSSLLGLLCLTVACSGSEPADPVVVMEPSGPVQVDCGELDPGAIAAGGAEELRRLIELWHDAKILAYVDAHPELVCAQLALDSLPPAAWKVWHPERVVDEVGVAGYVAVRRDAPEVLLTALFERGAPHGRVLGLAARSGRDRLVAWLLEQGVDPASGDALVEAAAAARLRAVEALLDTGADPDQRPSAGSLLDDDAPTPLFFAIYARRADIANVLLDAGAAGNIRTRFDHPDRSVTLLEWAVDRNLWPVAERLIEAGADPGDLPEADRKRLGRTASSRGLENDIAAFGS